MRYFSSNVLSILNSNQIKFFILVELNLNSDYFFTSHKESITYANNTYDPVQNGNAILEYDSPKFSSVVDRESYRIVLSDINDTLKAEIESNVVGKPITVKVGFLDSSDQPILNTGDILTVYKGYIDAPTLTNDFEGKTIVLDGTSPMSDLDIIVPLIASRDSARSRSSNTDKAFDKLYGNSVIRLKWGKI